MAMQWGQPFVKAFKSICYLVAHAIVAVAVLGVMSLIQWVIALDGNPRLFDKFPISYIFHAADIVILIVFLTYGTIDAIHVFRENDDE